MAWINIFIGLLILFLVSCAPAPSSAPEPLEDCDKVQLLSILPTDSTEEMWDKLEKNSAKMKNCLGGWF